MFIISCNVILRNAAVANKTAFNRHYLLLKQLSYRLTAETPKINFPAQFNKTTSIYFFCQLNIPMHYYRGFCVWPDFFQPSYDLNLWIREVTNNDIRGEVINTQPINYLLYGFVDCPFSIFPMWNRFEQRYAVYRHIIHFITSSSITLSINYSPCLSNYLITVHFCQPIERSWEHRLIVHHSYIISYLHPFTCEIMTHRGTMIVL